jgi:TRAP-type C4-dicarboxylate transport system substrate-binding protein
VPRLVETVPALQNEWKKNNVVPLSYGGLPPYGMVTIKPVKSLAGLKGLKVRVWGKTIPMRMVKLGMIPVTMASSETYEAMAKGTVGASLSPSDQHRSLGLWDVAKYHLQGDFIPALYAAQPIMNLKLFNSLEPSFRKILMDLQSDHLKKLKEMVVEADTADIKFLKDHGVNFPSLSETENKRLEQEALTAWEKMADELNANKDDVKAIKAAAERLKAEYVKTR